MSYRAFFDSAKPSLNLDSDLAKKKIVQMGNKIEKRLDRRTGFTESLVTS